MINVVLIKVLQALRDGKLFTLLNLDPIYLKVNSIELSLILFLVILKKIVQCWPRILAMFSIHAKYGVSKELNFD